MELELAETEAEELKITLRRFTPPLWVYGPLPLKPQIIIADWYATLKKGPEPDGSEPNNDNRPQYDVSIEAAEGIPSGGDRENILLSGGDAWYDIKVTGATYALLYVGDGHPDGSDDETTRNRTISLDQNGSDFTLADFSRDNPLFASATGSQVRVYTDGAVTYKRAYITYPAHHVYARLLGMYMVSSIPSRHLYVLNGNVWMPSATVRFNEVEVVENE